MAPQEHYSLYLSIALDPKPWNHLIIKMKLLSPLAKVN